VNRTPEIIAELRAAIAHAAAAELPAIVGQVAALQAEALARIVSTRTTAETDDIGEEQLLTAGEVAERLGNGTTSRWVRDHQDELPRVDMPGRTLRFSSRRLNAMIKRRSYG